MSRNSPGGLRIFRRVAAIALLGTVVLMALVGAIYTPFDPELPDASARLLPPSAEHWLGTDTYGRDQFSRLLGGASVSLWVGLLTVLAAVTSGTLLGAVAGYRGGWFDRAVTLLVESFLAMPAILLALAIMSIVGPSIYGLVLALGLAYAPRMARVVRSVVLSVREKEFIEASIVLGNSELYTLTRHVIPNCTAPIVIIGTSMFGSAILAESAISFLGLGVPPPVPSWGGMLSESRQALGLAPWLGVFPGLAICAAVLGVNLAGDGLRDVFDPRMHTVSEAPR